MVANKAGDRDGVATRGSGNVFEDLALDNAAELQAETLVTLEICKILKRRKLSQRQAAKLLDLAPADVNGLVNMRHAGFSLRRLMSILNKLDRDVEIVIKRRPRSRAHATLSVRTA